jgi:hypothetical protein
MGPLAGYPLYAPQGGAAILQAFRPGDGLDSATPLWLWDGLGEVSLQDEGSWPFWLDSERYGYLRRGEADEIVTAELADRLPRAVLTESDLAAAAGLDLTGSEREITFVGAAGPDQLVIMASVSRPAEERAALVAFDLERQEAHILLELSNVTASPPSFAPGGRWMSLQTSPSRLSSSALPQTLYLVALGEPWPVYSFQALTGLPASQTWSADGRWLARSGGRYVELFQPEALTAEGRPVHVLLDSGRRACYDAVWVAP